MHPNISAATYPNCIKYSEALDKCHKEHPVGKFFNACKLESSEVQKCYNVELEKYRRANLRQGRKMQKNLYESMQRTNEEQSKARKESQFETQRARYNKKND
eukprot:gb/GECH01012561.1/.p1 GENE.gb/GECH01012561.1/~~gb/GECH01012561.1/.p1  ORF type:complete len:102 (+),score=19.32 gb/GECH01012561.1/:1-306(+)